MSSLQSFFGPKLSHLLFGAAVDRFKVLQVKDTFLQYAAKAISRVKANVNEMKQLSVTFTILYACPKILPLYYHNCPAIGVFF